MNILLKKMKSDKGSSIILIALIMPVLIGVCALVFDFGTIAVEKSKLSNAVDAASLAAAQDLVVNVSKARETAENYIMKNQSNIEFSLITIDSDNRGIEVEDTKNIKNSFASLWGNSNENIKSVAKARIENIKSLEGVRPLAVIQQTFIYGKQYTLKEGGGDGTSGNYAGVALGGSGATNYENNMLYGYRSSISVGDVILTETGNIAGKTVSSINQIIGECNHYPQCTYDKYAPKCPRIIFIPVVNTLDVNGKKYIKVLGFATFFLEGVTSHSGQADVIGRFITYNMQGTTANDIGDYGTYSIKLVK